MTHQETPDQLEAAPEKVDAIPTAVDTVTTETAEALAGVHETALLNVLRELQTDLFFTTPAKDHVRATLNRTVWGALARAAQDFNLTIDQPSEERGELDPKNSVRFADSTEIALQIKEGRLTVFIKHPGRSGFYPLTRRYIV